MPEHPAEIPAEAEGGGGGRIDWSRLRGGIGGPQELPAAVWARRSFSHVVDEVFTLRNRVHTLESHILAAKIQGGAARFGLGGPNELPEGEGGGGGGVIQSPTPPGDPLLDAF
jgi:hypothetical protein